MKNGIETIKKRRD